MVFGQARSRFADLVGEPKALATAWPEPGRKPPRPSRLDPFKPAIDDILRADPDAV
jgi:hypothetical protein